MKSDDPSSGIDRRALVSSLALVPTLYTTLLSSPVRAQTTPNVPLASWNDGAPKHAIIDFVRATTDQASAQFVPPEERIACFDQDGTLWVEHPIYTQVVYCLDRVPAVVAQKPALKNREPFKTVLSGNREAYRQALVARPGGSSRRNTRRHAGRGISSRRREMDRHG